ncbi:beta-galactosidase [Lentzea sp. NBRC 105346]|uniref:glycoside hydrolase family 2 TIM barrel-domain containing protein n=1 Tax=Lentzea sp. NBRC 105346 TaxID=3032205 RepID=UPI0024A0DCA4|nr:glycoside hydrolase family 2 TIM barrel-domain containing protein [Lentzea sp. NBRC 105346]GLZ36362.1 beta-galactosidase [Lentzea sp. NBRC 105346]
MRSIVAVSLSIVMVSAQMVSAQAAPALDVYRYLEDPRMTGEGQQPHHAVLPSPNTASLDGDWKVKVFDLPEQVPTDFPKNGYDVRQWRTVSVPHTLQTDGLDHPMFRNTVEEVWPDDPPHVPRDVNPTAAYVRSFDIPERWDERTFLRFEGVTAGYFVWVNGHYVGFDQGGYTPAEFDITDKLVPGRNRLAVQVHRWGAGSYLEDYDQWRFSGIFRSVWLYSTPRDYIQDVAVSTKGDVLTAQVETVGTGEVQGWLYDKDGRQVAAATGTTLTMPVRDPLRWNDETPNLYTLVLRMGRHVTRETVGLRDITIADRQLKVDGKRVLFKGVNRPETDPDHGRHQPRSRQEQDVDLMKRLHINAVRTAHYPSDPYFYKLADERGLWIDDEMDVETHAHENCPADCLADRPEWSDAFLERFVAMVERDKNHPSVFMWDTGNEAGLGAAHFRMAEWARAHEPSRPLYHQPNRPNGDAPFADVYGPRYPSPEKFATLVAQTTKPLIMGEYAHAMGNSLGNFREFWDVIRANPQAQGGFVWDWAEQNMRQKLRVLSARVPTHLAGLPVQVDGHRGKALQFSGLDDFVEVYRDPSLDITGPLTLDAWVRPAKWSGDFTIVSKGNAYGLRMKDAKTLEFYAGKSVTAPVPADFYDRFHRVTGVYDGATLKLSIDDVPVAAAEHAGGVPGNAWPVNIGRNAQTHREKYNGRTAHGVIDDVRILAGTKPVLELDFDRIEERGTYLSHGNSLAGVDGVVSADRVPQPEAAQLAWVHQPLRFALNDRTLSVTSERSFAALDFELRWDMSGNGRSGSQPLRIGPGATVRVPVPDGDGWYTVRAMVGNEVFAHDQFSLGGTEAVEPPAAGEATSEQTADAVVLRGKGVRYEVDKATGGLRSMRVRGVELLHAKGTELDVWRAPISNETADWGKAEANDWRAVGLDRMRSVAKSVTVEGNTVVVRSTAGAADAAFEQTLRYAVDATGTIRIEHTVEPTGKLRTLPYLPVMGLQIPVPKRFQKFSWYGRGPQESYNDRKDGTPMGVWKSTVDRQYVDYDSPQSNGNHTDTRWALLTDGISGGLLVSGANDVSVSRYDSLDRAVYGFEKQANPGWITLHADHLVTGVGDTPNPVRERFQVRPDRTHSYRLTLRPLTPSEIWRGAAG